jgi:hypothetical protein
LNYLPQPTNEDDIVEQEQQKQLECEDLLHVILSNCGGARLAWQPKHPQHRQKAIDEESGIANSFW